MKTRPGSPARGVTLWREMEESVRVLVVEDEPKMAGLLRRGLAEEGYAVDAVADGLCGFGAAAIRGYDAVVLDVMLPNLSGFEFCRRLRQRPTAAAKRGVGAGADAHRPATRSATGSVAAWTVGPMTT